MGWKICFNGIRWSSTDVRIYWRITSLISFWLVLYDKTYGYRAVLSLIIDDFITIGLWLGCVLLKGGVNLLEICQIEGNESKNSLQQNINHSWGFIVWEKRVYCGCNVVNRDFWMLLVTSSNGVDKVKYNKFTIKSIFLHDTNFDLVEQRRGKTVKHNWNMSAMYQSSKIFISVTYLLWWYQNDVSKLGFRQ